MEGRGAAVRLAEELRGLYLAAGRPTYRALVRWGTGQEPKASLSDATLSAWFNPGDPTIPKDERVFWLLVQHLQTRARSVTPSYGRRNEGWWKQLRTAAWNETHQRRGGRSAKVADAGQQSAESGSVSVMRRTARPGRPIAELIDPFDLEVHRAIDAGPLVGQLPVLPVYVPREHDVQVTEVVDRAVGGVSGVVVLVGRSSTGKTRACWEAIQRLPDGWRLWHPINPGRALAAAEAIAAVGPRTVVWLNEAQHYLLTPDSDLGERVAAGLRELLHDPTRGPVLILGTIWPEYWAVLTTDPVPGQEDAHLEARGLLGGTAVPVPDAFTRMDLAHLLAISVDDPRLAQAAEQVSDGRVTQYLAGGPALLDRYWTAPAAVKALIHAAIDVRRLGHELALPYGLLEAATSVYLSSDDWDALDDDWLEQALAFTAASCKGARGLLSRIRPRPGQPLLRGEPFYRLADYLEEHGRVTRVAALVPAGLWDVLLAHASPDSLSRIADSAAERSLYRIAHMIYRASADAGDSNALRRAAELLDQAGRVDEAIEAYRRAVEVGDDRPTGRMGELLDQAGRVDEAIEAYRRAAEAGDSGALEPAVALLEQAGRHQEAVTWLEARADAGDDNALQLLAMQLAAAGRVDEAVDSLQSRAHDSHVALESIALMLERAERTDEAIAWLQAAAEAGNVDASQLVAKLLERAGRLNDAITWLQSRADAGDRTALWPAAKLLRQTGQISEAIAVFRTGGEQGDAFAAQVAAELLERVGRVDEAIEAYRSAAAAGHHHAFRRVAELLEEAGRIDEAIHAYREAADAGDLTASQRAAALLEEAGRIDEAVDVLCAAAAEGDDFGLRAATELFVRTGQVEEAVTWLRSRAEADDAVALRQAAELMARVGQIKEAIEWLQSRAGDGDESAHWPLARLLEKRGRIEEAIAADLRGAELGHIYAMESAARLSRQEGRIDEVITFLRELADDPDALRLAVHLLAEENRTPEAITWLQSRAGVGDTTALWKAAELLERTGHTDDAITWLQARTEAGDANAADLVADLLRRVGRREEAIDAYLRAAAAGSTCGLFQAATLLEQADYRREAQHLRRFGLEPSGQVADWHP